jgi:hypothetical protein
MKRERQTEKFETEQNRVFDCLYRWHNPAVSPSIV